MKRALLTALALAGAPAVARRMHRNRVLIVTYHGFTEGASPPGAENSFDLHLPVARLRQQLLYLRRRYHVVPLERVVAHYAQGRPLPPYPAALTIDDGYRSTYTLAYPVLRALGLPATLFVATDFVGRGAPLLYDRVEYALGHTPERSVTLAADGKAAVLPLGTAAQRAAAVGRVRALLRDLGEEGRRRLVEELERRAGVALRLDGAPPALYAPLTWDEVREMAAGGLVTVGSHTCTHPSLARVPLDAARREVVRSRQAVEREVGSPCRLFSYPYGGPGDVNAAVRALVREAGYAGAVATLSALNGRDADPFALCRVHAPSDLRDFALRVSGCRALLTSLRRGPRRPAGAPRRAPRRERAPGL